MHRIGAILGIGLAGTPYQMVFHESLQWHTLYVHTSPFSRTFVDGLFHLARAHLPGCYWSAGCYGAAAGL